MESEVEFRERLANILSNEPYNHEVYFHEGDYERKFSVGKVRGFVDLYVVTGKTWKYHELFPVIGIETKIASNLGWVSSVIRQTDRYVKARTEARYYINGELVPPPTIFLVCTDQSFYEGDIYQWQLPQLKKQVARKGGWVMMTEFFDRELHKVGAAILRQGCFYTNMFGNHGAITKYYLDDRDSERTEENLRKEA